MRDVGIQYLRVSAMLIIVAYHCVCYYGVWPNVFPDAPTYEYINICRGVCGLALNAFVFISGVLFTRSIVSGRYGSASKQLSVKFRRLLFPYLIWSVVAVLLFPSPDSLMQVVCGVQHLWFLLMLTMIFVLIILMGGGIVLKYSVLGFVISAVANLVVSKVGDTVPNILAWKMALRYLPAFFAGVLAVKYRIDFLIGQLKWSVRMPLILLITAFMAVTIVVPSLPYGLLYISFVTYAWLMCIYAGISNYRTSLRSGKLLESLDRNSMGIYIIHHFAIWAVLLFIPFIESFMNMHNIVAPLCLFVVVMPFSWLMARFLLRYKYTSLLFNFSFKI